MIDDYPAWQSSLNLSQSGAALPSTHVLTYCCTRSDSFFSQSVAPKVAHAEREIQGGCVRVAEKGKEKRGPAPLYKPSYVRPDTKAWWVHSLVHVQRVVCLSGGWDGTRGRECGI